MKIQISRGALACALLTSTCLSQAVGQTNGSEVETARRYDVTSPTGVSYPTGSYAYNIELLSIGLGEFPQSLSYGLNYNSGSARAPNQPWTHNLTVRMSKTLVDDPRAEFDNKPNPPTQTWLHNVVMGQRSSGFEKLGANPGGTSLFKPVTKSGDRLTFTTTDAQGNFNTIHGYFTYTGKNGEVITFRNVDLAEASGRAASWVEADGTTLTYGYAGAASSISSNRGYAIFFEAPQTVGSSTSSKVCALNLARHFLGALNACPAGVPTTTINSSSGPNNTGFAQVTSIVNSADGVHNYGYSYSNAGGRVRQHLNCVKNPGQTSCAVTNVYDSCDGPNRPPEERSSDPNWNGSRDRVTSQTLATGETLTYAYPPQAYSCRGSGGVTMTDAAEASTVVVPGWPQGVIEQVTDPLRRRSSFTYTGGSDTSFTDGSTLISTITLPEDDITTFVYDDRGNKTETRRKAKPGSSSDDLVTTAVYLVTCDNPKTCNKPTSTTDARLQTTNYTYDPVHGGLLTEWQPAPSTGAARPLKLFTHVQKYAYVKNASGTLVPAASPVWLAASQTICQTAAASNSPTCDPGARQVVTTYEYGVDGSPDNLLLRGIVTDVGGLNLRTCYTYDQVGNKISETAPKASLSSCQ